MAADGWQDEYSKFVVSIGFRESEAFHASRDVLTSVHSDDFTSSGSCESLDWLERTVAEQYDISVDPSLSPGPKDAKGVQGTDISDPLGDGCIE